MRLADLATRSSISASTIKYYLRVGLLHPGQRQSSTWSIYDDSHLRRLALIRALSEVAGLPLESVRRVLEVVDDESVQLHDALGTAQWLLSSPVAQEPTSHSAQRVNSLIERHQWQLSPDSPHRRVLADALDRLDQLDFCPPDALLDQYAQMLSTIAASEVGPITTETDRASAIEHLVIGTLLYEPLLTTMRRMAHESDSAQRSKIS